MISVVMPTYNCAPFIRQSIKSILNQTYKDFEFLIIDDGSTDNTEEIISSFSDNRIVYKIIEHCGLSKALNYGLNISRNDMIARMDADDISHPLRLEKQLSYSSNKNNEIIFSDSAFFLKNKILYTLTNLNDQNFINQKLALHGHFTHPSVIYHKSHILESKGYNESLSVFEDYDLWLRIKDKSNFIFVNEILQFQRISKGSLTNNDPNYLNQKIYEIQKPYYHDLSSSFCIINDDEQNIIKGWRDFFYGNKNQTRFLWRKIEIAGWDYRMIIAYILSFLPSKTLNHIKSLRFRLRLEYLFNRNKKFKGLEKEFRDLLRVVSK